MAKLKKSVKKKWVEALRSGKYEQTKGFLNKGDRYCCLGVLCEVAIESDIAVQVTNVNGFKAYDGHQANLPTSVADWAFLKSHPASLGNARVSARLSAVNDAGVSFSEIADLIEKNL